MKPRARIDHAVTTLICMVASIYFVTINLSCKQRSESESPLLGQSSSSAELAQDAGTLTTVNQGLPSYRDVFDCAMVTPWLGTSEWRNAKNEKAGLYFASQKKKNADISQYYIMTQDGLFIFDIEAVFKDRPQRPLRTVITLRKDAKKLYSRRLVLGNSIGGANELIPTENINTEPGTTPEELIEHPGELNAVAWTESVAAPIIGRIRSLSEYAIKSSEYPPLEPPRIDNQEYQSLFESAWQMMVRFDEIATAKAKAGDTVLSDLLQQFRERNGAWRGWDEEFVLDSKMDLPLGLKKELELYIELQRDMARFTRDAEKRDLTNLEVSWNQNLGNIRNVQRLCRSIFTADMNHRIDRLPKEAPVFQDEREFGCWLDGKDGIQPASVLGYTYLHACAKCQARGHREGSSCLACGVPTAAYEDKDLLKSCQ